MTRKQWLYLALALVLLAVLKVVALGWYLHHRASVAPLEPVACATDSSACALPNGARLLFLEPVVEGRPFLVALEGVDGEEPSSEFTMRSMDMGFNRYRFVRAHGRWEARVTLPACVSGRHDWMMTVNLAQHRYQLALSVSQ